MNQPTPAQPGASSAAAHRKAEAQLAAWNGPRRISKMPASVGTVARKPEEAAQHDAQHAPALDESRRAQHLARPSRSGAHCSSAGPTFTPSA